MNATQSVELKSVMLDDLHGALESIPPLPAILLAVTEMANDPETEDAEFAKVIEADQVMTARLLKVANSAFYGRTGSVTTIPGAISVLGRHGVRNLIIALSLLDHKMGGRASAEQRELFWRHSISVASIARQLGARFPRVDPDEAFLAGLIHDIGKLVFIEFYPDLYKSIWEETVRTGRFLHDVEAEVFGIDHSQIGSILCWKWNLPPPLDQAVGFHQLLIDEGRIADRSEIKSVIVRAADNLARISGLGKDGESYIGLDVLKLIDRKNLFLENFSQILADLPDYVAEVESIFSLNHLKSPLDRKPRRYNVVVSEGSEADILKLMLIAQGHEVVIPPSISNLESTMDPIILDVPLPPEILKPVSQKGVQVLNFGLWKEIQTAVLQAGFANVSDLRTWLHQYLPDLSSSGILNQKNTLEMSLK